VYYVSSGGRAPLTRGAAEDGSEHAARLAGAAHLLGSGVTTLKEAQSASTALVGADPARPHAGRLGRGWPRPTRGLGASLPPPPSGTRILPPGRQVSVDARLHGMQPLKAHVKNGRVVLDEPLELPEDTELEVGSLHVVDTGDDFDDEERERLHRALDAAIESVQAGRTVDGNGVIRRLLSRP